AACSLALRHPRRLGRHTPPRPRHEKEVCPMKVTLESRRPAQSRADVVVLGRHTDGAPGEVADVDQRLGGSLPRALAAEKFEAKPGQISYFFTNGKLPAARVMVVGLGARASADAGTGRGAAARAG